MGIATSRGIIRDFAGPYFVSVSFLDYARLFVDATLKVFNFMALGGLHGLRVADALLAVG